MARPCPLWAMLVTMFAARVGCTDRLTPPLAWITSIPLVHPAGSTAAMCCSVLPHETPSVVIQEALVFR